MLLPMPFRINEAVLLIKTPKLFVLLLLLRLGDFVESENTH